MYILYTHIHIYIRMYTPLRTDMKYSDKKRRVSNINVYQLLGDSQRQSEFLKDRVWS